MGASASKEQAVQNPHGASLTAKEAHLTRPAPHPWASVGSVYGFSACTGAQPVTDAACWPVVRTPCVIHSWMGCPATWTYMWAPYGGDLWVGHPPPAASAPSVWPWGVSSFDSRMGGQHWATMASSVLPYFIGPPPLCSSGPPALSRDAPGHCTQVGWQTPTNSAFPAPVGVMSRGASPLKKCQAPPSEWASRFSIWAPAPSSSPELRPLPPSPSSDPQPNPRCPRSPRPPCRACRRLFEL
ncbi:putative uncharacterized protein C3orf56 homolog [Equus quagga]|uniref:putative uncharacterized protein C3orf56 homolog n=1 Tax=Equus quagga TaxID=89248 RepID=UPI001EE19EA8|nr:putative uncharacterized protein C3orf56 homolog [Equus quagga]